jgi:hypothetical protein
MALPASHPCSCGGQNPNCSFCGGWGFIADGEPLPMKSPAKSFVGQTEEQRLRESKEKVAQAAAVKSADAQRAYAARQTLEDDELTRAHKTGRAYSVSWCLKCGKMKVGVDGNLFVPSTMNSPCAGCGGTKFRS